jgi:flagellar assembly factor FliW
MTNTKLKTKKIKSSLVKTISTRLGVIEYKTQDLFKFNNGICGFENLKKFILTFLPYEGTPDNYRFLQSAEQPELAMIVMNIMIKDDNKNSLIAANDLEPHLKFHNLKLADVAIFLVVAIHVENNIQRVSVNTKAPIVLALNQQLGWQVILDNPDYQVSKYLT